MIGDTRSGMCDMGYAMWDKKRKYDDTAIIEPTRVIEERKKIGLHPSCPMPAGADRATTAFTDLRLRI